MIKSDSQYRLTQTRIKEFEQTLRRLPSRSSDKRQRDLAKIQRDAITSQIADLAGELRAYEDLKSGHCPPDTPETVRELRLALIQGRIAQGLSRKELADRTNLQERDIQDYEETEYDSVNFSQIKKIASVLGIKAPTA